MATTLAATSKTAAIPAATHGFTTATATVPATATSSATDTTTLLAGSGEVLTASLVVALARWVIRNGGRCLSKASCVPNLFHRGTTRAYNSGDMRSWSVSPFGAEQHICGIAGYDGRPRRCADELRALGARLKRLTRDPWQAYERSARRVTTEMHRRLKPS